MSLALTAETAAHQFDLALDPASVLDVRDAPGGCL